MCSDRSTRSALAGAILGLAVVAHAAPVGYTSQVFQFDPSAGDPNTPRYTAGISLNNAGQFVGTYALGSDTSFLYTPGLGAQTLVSIYGKDGVRPSRILNSGQIIGTIAENFESARAFIGSPSGTITYLPTFNNDPTLRTVAVGATPDTGIVFGSSSTPGGGFTSVATAWINGQAVNLGTLGGDFGVATGANSAGVIVGDSSLEPFGPTRAFRWTADEGMVELMTSDAYIFSTARAVLDDGTIIGEVGTDFSLAAAIWSPDGQLTVLPSVFSDAPVLNAEVFGVNIHGDFVGQELDWNNDNLAAVLWQGGQGYKLADYATDLPEGIILQRAVSINDLGQILVNAFDTNNFQFVTVLLTPIPAPSAGVLLASGALVFARRRR